MAYRTRTRLGWTLSYVSRIFVHPNPDLAPLFVGKRVRSIGIKGKKEVLVTTNVSQGEVKNTHETELKDNFFFLQ